LRVILILFPKPVRTVAFQAQNPPKKVQKRGGINCPQSILGLFLSGENPPSARCVGNFFSGCAFLGGGQNIKKRGVFAAARLNVGPFSFYLFIIFFGYSLRLWLLGF
jgi:hypothetical protein